MAAGKEKNDKTFEDFEHIEEIPGEQKEKTCTYTCPAVNRGWWWLSPSITSQPWFRHPKSLLLYSSPISVPLCFSSLTATCLLLTNPLWLKGKFPTLCLKSPVPRSLPFQLPTHPRVFPVWPSSVPSLSAVFLLPSAMHIRVLGYPTCGFSSYQPEAAWHMLYFHPFTCMIAGMLLDNWICLVALLSLWMERDSVWSERNFRNLDKCWLNNRCRLNAGCIYQMFS